MDDMDWNVDIDRADVEVIIKILVHILARGLSINLGITLQMSKYCFYCIEHIKLKM
jgi:hypothetical protein